MFSHLKGSAEVSTGVDMLSHLKGSAAESAQQEWTCLIKESAGGGRWPLLPSQHRSGHV